MELGTEGLVILFSIIIGGYYIINMYNEKDLVKITSSVDNQKYTVQINETGVYKAQVRVATTENGGGFHLAVDGEAVTTTQSVSSTGWWTDFAMHDISDIVLTEGVHELKLYFDNNTAFNVSSIEFTKTGEIAICLAKISYGSNLPHFGSQTAVTLTPSSII